jgi:photosystem II stability/assembly factor-like uncharacterized protein
MNGASCRRLARFLAYALPLAALPAGAQFGGEGGGGGGTGGDLTRFVKELRQSPAMRLASPTHAAMMAAAAAGKRVVAVGDHGVVLLSDDGGRTYRQAREVPTRVMLNSVCFVDDRRGWAAGHWGIVLHTEDAGETWKLQRQDTKVDQPLFSVYFADHNHGLVVGLWSLALRTEDGGASWTPVAVPAPAGAGKSGPNLYQIFPASTGATLFIAAEAGLVYRSDDSGQSWTMVATGNRGSLWTGLALPDGALLVAGLNGKILRSTDGGRTWTAVDSGVPASITDLAQGPGGVIGVGLEGAFITSRDGVSFSAKPRADRASLTAVLVTAQGSPLLFSEDGVVEAN